MKKQVSRDVASELRRLGVYRETLESKLDALTAELDAVKAAIAVLWVCRSSVPGDTKTRGVARRFRTHTNVWRLNSIGGCAGPRDRDR